MSFVKLEPLNLPSKPVQPILRILYLGDIMAQMGIDLIKCELPKLRQQLGVDYVIAQGENVTEGKGISPADYDALLGVGVDFFTGGNHTPSRPDIYPLLEDVRAPIVGPANLPGCPGPGHKLVTIGGYKLLIVSILGNVVGRMAKTSLDNPLRSIDSLLNSELARQADIKLVNFHGDFSSEKVVFGHYLDGRVSAVVGDHWHVPSADWRVLDGGTAYISDVGMCGSLDSSLGVKYESIIKRWRDGHSTYNNLEDNGAKQLNGVIIEVDPSSGKALQINQVRKLFAS